MSGRPSALALLFITACVWNACGGTDGANGDAPPDAGADATPDSADASAPDSGADANDGATCAPGETESCYSGPTGTEDVGACHAGVRVCAPDGSGFGSCLNEVLPALEICATPVDDDCDGAVNEEGADCTCTPGEASDCYSGAASTLGVGACKAGTQVCKPDGSGYGQCFGEVAPAQETCATPVDDDCDGELNEEGPDCVCVPGSSEECYSGPSAAKGVGASTPGTRTCSALGTAWGPCTGEVLPTAESCATPLDDDCDGEVNEEGADCVCTPGSTLPCYSGPAGTLDVGVCKSGTQTCGPSGTGYLACAGQVAPGEESCATFMDEDCDAVPECIHDVAHLFGPGNPGSSLDTPEVIAFGPGPGPDMIFIDNGARRWRRIDQYGKPILDLPISVSGVAAFGGMSFRHNDTAAVLFGRYSFTPDFGTGALPVGSDSLFVAQYDISGNVAWAKGFPSASGAGAKMSRRNDTPSGGAPEVWVVGGVYTGSANLGGGTLPPWPTPSKTNVYVAALDLTGNTVWSRALGSGPMPDDIGLSGIRQQISASYVVGTVRGDLDVGAGTMPSAGGSDVYVARLATSDGSTVWSKRYGGSGDETALVAMGRARVHHRHHFRRSRLRGWALAAGNVSRELRLFGSVVSCGVAEVLPRMSTRAHRRYDRGRRDRFLLCAPRRWLRAHARGQGFDGLPRDRRAALAGSPDPIGARRLR